MNIDFVIQWAIFFYILFSIVILILISIKFYTGKMDEKLLEFSKWYLVSIALVLIANIIENGFREREIAIAEMEVYDSYVETVIQADNIETRWKLAQFFSNVTPADRLKGGWTSYMDSIRTEYKEFKELRNTQNELKADTSFTNVKRIIEIESKLKPFEKSLIPPEYKTVRRVVTIPSTGKWVLIFITAGNFKTAKEYLNNLKKAGHEDLKILKIGDQSFGVISQIFRSEINALKYRKNGKNSMERNAILYNLNKSCPDVDLDSDIIECSILF